VLRFGYKTDAQNTTTSTVMVSGQKPLY